MLANEELFTGAFFPHSDTFDFSPLSQPSFAEKICQNLTVDKRSHLFHFWLLVGSKAALFTRVHNAALHQPPNMPASRLPPSSPTIITTKQPAPSLPILSSADSEDLVVGLLSYRNTVMKGRNFPLTLFYDPQNPPVPPPSP